MISVSFEPLTTLIVVPIPTSFSQPETNSAFGAAVVESERM